MKKYQKKIATLIILSILLSLILTAPVSAYVYLRPKSTMPYYYTINDLQWTTPIIHTPRLGSGCSSIDYYVSTSMATTAYATGVNNAVAEWDGYSDSSDYWCVICTTTWNYWPTVRQLSSAGIGTPVI